MKKKNKLVPRSILDNWSVSQDELPSDLNDQRKNWFISGARLEHMLTVADHAKYTWTGETLRGLVDRFVDRIRNTEERFRRGGAKGNLWLLFDGPMLYLFEKRWLEESAHEKHISWAEKIIADRRNTNAEDNVVEYCGTLFDNWQILVSGLMPAQQVLVGTQDEDWHNYLVKISIEM